MAETCVFVKQSPRPAFCGPRGSPCTGSPQGHSISRSYGVNLPSSLTGVVSNTWGFLSPPTGGGLRYGRPYLPSRGFSGQPRFNRIASGCPLTFPSPQLNGLADLPTSPRLEEETHHVQWARPVYLSGSPLDVLISGKGGAGMLTCYPSPTPFGLGLGPTNPTRINLA